uniref:Low-density lipoprotein receptor domain class A n=1 Tax=Anisakis simplex TaxID=6269 RepID=A0A0M3K8J3_ANISI
LEQDVVQPAIEEPFERRITEPLEYESEPDDDLIAPPKEPEEESCLEHEFRCGSGECIDRRRLCDTRRDCRDASDEANCVQSQPQQQQPAAPAAVPAEQQMSNAIEANSMQLEFLAHISLELAA